MRSLQKLPEPDILTRNKDAWTRSYAEAISSNSKAPNHWTHSEIRKQLNAETDRRCAYCDSHIANVAQAHIEHFRPRAKYPELVVAWDNLTIACPRCNNQKRDKFDEDLPFINPLHDDPTAHFIFFGDVIFPAGSNRAIHTINEIGLNNDDLVAARKRRIIGITRLVDAWRKAESVLKEGILEEIYRELHAGEHQATVKALLLTSGISLSNTRKTITVRTSTPIVSTLKPAGEFPVATS
ncbi:retron system putative HNH endonuclease [Arthrobacter sp. 2RAF6]|uniref:retron system putative HNH endonuclease n=1 Tax=Arthrobacter sp. 2RAF6 TaxID=3233002 RepID=UPI003F92EDD9